MISFNNVIKARSC